MQNRAGLATDNNLSNDRPTNKIHGEDLKLLQSLVNNLGSKFYFYFICDKLYYIILYDIG